MLGFSVHSLGGTMDRMGAFDRNFSSGGGIVHDIMRNHPIRGAGIGQPPRPPLPESQQHHRVP